MLSALLYFCDHCCIPRQRSSNVKLGCFCVVVLNKLLNKLWSCQRFHKPWHVCDVTVMKTSECFRFWQMLFNSYSSYIQDRYLQMTSHYLSQCWHRSVSPNGTTRPQRVSIALSRIEGMSNYWYGNGVTSLYSHHKYTTRIVHRQFPVSPCSLGSWISVSWINILNNMMDDSITGEHLKMLMSS